MATISLSLLGPRVPLFLSPSLSFPDVHKSCLPPRFSSSFLCRRSTRVARRERSIADEHPPGVSAGDEERWSSCWSLKFTPLPLFLADFGTVRPPFPVKPLILEWAFDPLQNYTPLVGRIITVEKSVTIHIVPSTAFFSESEKFREVRPPKAWCTFHKLSFDIYIYIYIGYVLRTFRNHVLRDPIVNLSFVSIRVQD